MGISINIESGILSVTLNYSGETSKVNAVLNNAVTYVYDRLLKYQIYDANQQRVPLVELTNNQKLNILDHYVLDTIKDASKNNYILEEIESARETAELNVGSTQELE